MGKKTNLYKSFDRLGILAFLFFFVNSTLHLVRGDYAWDIIVSFVVALGGLIVDIYLVFIYKEE